jgi:hypothetical protein
MTARSTVAALVCLLAATWSPAPVAAGVSSAATLIETENAKPGTTDWYVPSPDQTAIAGYASDVSYRAGDTVTLFVDSKGDPFSYTVYRMGYYQGLGGRAVSTGDVASNPAQPAPTITDDRPGGAKLLLTHWHPSASFPVDRGWVTGFYLVKLVDQNSGAASYATFTVRSAVPAPLVVSFSTNTWQAYNVWGGLSLYRDLRLSAPQDRRPDLVAHTVSFRRPYLETYGAGEFFRFDRPLVEYLEQHGMPVSYATDEDARMAREAGRHTRMVIVDGHSEYHGRAERRYLTALPPSGVSIAFTGGNDFVWQARLDDRRHRMSVWRKRRLDPVKQRSRATIRWELVGWNQDALTGEMQAWAQRSAPEAAYATRHWAWRGAAVDAGTALGGLQGNEYDGVVVNRSTPSHLTVLARSPLTPPVASPNQPPAAQAMTIVERPGQGFVFSAGMTGFDWYVDYPGVTSADWINPQHGRYPTSSHVSPPVRRLVGNLLARALGVPNPEPSAERPERVTPPMHILSPQRNQPVFSAPGRPAVTWADAPAGTVRIRIAYAGRRVATVGPRRDFWIGRKGVRLSGLHTITVAAVDARGRVIARGRRRADFRPPSDPIFRDTRDGLMRLWGAIVR